MKKARLLDFRPTQFVLGMREVDYRKDFYLSLKKKESEKYLEDHVVPVALGPQKELFVLDHHHFLRSFWELGEKEARYKVVEDLHKKDYRKFWALLRKKNYLYLHDQFGLGPHDPDSLPSDIRSMADDPFRSLAWEMILHGHVEKQRTFYFEFIWASFLRENHDHPLHSKSDFDKARKHARLLVHSREASHLPGFKKKS